MSDSSLKTLHDNISDLISRRRLAQAIDQVEATLSVYNAPWQLRAPITVICGGMRSTVWLIPAVRHFTMP